EIGRLILLEIQLVKGRLMRRSKVYFYLLFIQIHRIRIRGDFFLVIAVWNNRREVFHIPLKRAQIEGGTTPVTGHDERKAMQAITREITALGINTQETIGEMDSRIGRHQQVADVSHIWIYVVDRRIAGWACTAACNRYCDG